MKKLNLDLILEGGGVRCFFTHGIIDNFLREGIIFNSIYGVSAGSLAGALYKSRQVNFIPEFFSLFKDKGIESSDNGLIDMYQLLKYIDNNMIEFDYETFSKSEEKFYIVILNAKTGQTEYIDSSVLANKDELFLYLAASCSIPGIAQSVMIGDEIYYDGGYSDPIPVFKSFMDKQNKKIIILTREESYYKHYEEESEDLSVLVPYEKVVYSMENRYVKYNDSKIFSLYLQEKKDALVFMPEIDIDFDSLDYNSKNLLDLYRNGSNQSVEKLEEIVGLDD